jgi:hypothetical protein
MYIYIYLYIFEKKQINLNKMFPKIITFMICCLIYYVKGIEIINLCKKKIKLKLLEK